jgi:hypothetical protein
MGCLAYQLLAQGRGSLQSALKCMKVHGALDDLSHGLRVQETTTGGAVALQKGGYGDL